VLGADTRSTAGSTVADKNCEKIHFVAPNIYCCGAGTAADTENVTGERFGVVGEKEGEHVGFFVFPTRPSPPSTGMVSSALTLHRYATDRESRVVTALTLLKNHLFRYQGHVSAALVLGGVDVEGPHLFTVYPHGSTDALPFATMGSGSLNAMAVFEAGYKDGMSRDEAIALVTRAIRAGIYNDLGSGSNVDICVITKDKVRESGKGEEWTSREATAKEKTRPNTAHTPSTPHHQVDYLRNHEYLQGRTYERVHPVSFPPGTAPVDKTKTLPAHAAARVLEPEAAEAMEVVA
jgi:20S proteasome subunit beta 2